MLISQCILGLKSQSIDFINAFSQEYITSRESFFIEITRYFKSNGVQCDFVIMLKKSLYVQSKSAHLWYKSLQNGLLHRAQGGYKIIICVVYVYGCLFWARSKSNIYDAVKYFKEYGPS